MRRILDIADGLTTWHDFDPETKVTSIYTEGDAEPGLEWAKNLAKSDEYTRQGIKKGHWHYCHIPNPVLMQWYAMGVDISRAENLVEMVNRPEWSYLKTTGKVHREKH